MRRLAPAVALLATLTIVAPGSAQVPDDASVLPRGTLRLTVDPQRAFWSQRFTTAGVREPWGADFARTLDASAIPSLGPVEEALRSLTGIPSLTLSLGASSLTSEADVRGTPLTFELGLTRRLTVGLALPIVRTRVKATLALDGAGATVGWNPTLPQAADPAGLTAYEALFAQLDAATATLEASIAAGGYGCPSEPSCDAARDLALRARAFRADLAGVVLGGVGGLGPAPVLPLASTAAAQALTGVVGGLQADFATLGIAGFTQAPAFPTAPLTVDQFQALIRDPVLGIGADSLATVADWKLGDLALSAKYLLVNGARYRAAVAGVVRLPTGTLDDPDRFLDLAGGDRQLDLEVRLHQDVRPFDEFAVSTAVRYVHQRQGTLVRRAVSHTTPFGPLASRFDVERDLGDVFQVSIAPEVLLSPQVGVYLVGLYHRKGRDRVSAEPRVCLPEEPLPCTFDPQALEVDTEEEAWRFGGGVRYRAPGRFETGLTYLSTFRGSGGLTPARSFVAVSLRLYYGLFGSPEPMPESPP